MPIDFSQVSVYLVTDPVLSEGRSELEVVRAAFAGGVRLVQYRDKLADARTYLEKARALSVLCRELGVWLLLNDRVLNGGPHSRRAFSELPAHNRLPARGFGLKIIDVLEKRRGDDVNGFAKSQSRLLPWRRPLQQE